VGKGDLEVLVPYGILTVGNDPSASHGSSGEADRDVRIAGDDFPVFLVLVLLLIKER